MTERLNHLHVSALARDASLMQTNAVSACSRWCGPQTTLAEVEAFVQRQLASLDGLDDSLSSEIRDSWQWLAGELGTLAAAPPSPSRLSRFTGRRDRGRPAPDEGLRVAA